MPASERILPVLAFLAGALLPLASGCAGLKAERERNLALESQMDRLREENSAFQKAYYQIKEQKESESALLQERIDALARELETAKNYKSDQERRLEGDLQTRTMTSDAMLRDVQARLEESAAKLAKADAALTDGEQKRLALRAEAEAAAARAAKLEAEIKELTERLKAAEAKAAAETEARTKAEAGAAEAAKAAESRIEEAAREAGKSREEAEALKNRLADAEKKAARAAPDPAGDEALIRAAGSLKEALAPLGEGAEAKVDRKGLRVILPGDALFRSGTLNLSEAAPGVLAAVSGALKDLNDRRIRVEGHTDNQPVGDLPFADNWGLGSARADRVRLKLEEAGGLDGAALDVVSRADKEPLGDNKTPEGRAKNRRVEIVVEAKRGE